MSGERDLAKLLPGMNPVLDPAPYLITSLPGDSQCDLPAAAWAVIHEDEGCTLILTSERAQQAGLPVSDPWARITLMIHSDLHAVGLLARVSQALAGAGIPLNVISAFHHDHLFVPWQQRQAAMEHLLALSRLA